MDGKSHCDISVSLVGSVMVEGMNPVTRTAGKKHNYSHTMYWSTTNSVVLPRVRLTTMLHMYYLNGVKTAT